MHEAFKPIVMSVQKLINLPQPSTAAKDEQAKKSIPNKDNVWEVERAGGTGAGKEGNTTLNLQGVPVECDDMVCWKREIWTQLVMFGKLLEAGWWLVIYQYPSTMITITCGRRVIQLPELWLSFSSRRHLMKLVYYGKYILTTYVHRKYCSATS